MEKTRVNLTEEDLLRQLTEDRIRAYAPAIAFSAFVVVFGILGNAISVAFYGFKVPRTSTNIIITVLAIVDIITCVVLSDEIVELCFTVSFKNIWGCKAMYFFNHTLVVISIFTLLLVAFDRFRKICRPFSWQYSTFTLKLSFTVIIVFAVLLSVRDWVILDVIHVNVTYAERNITAYYCTHSREKSMAVIVKAFQFLDFLILIVIVVSTVVLYSCIAKKLWKSRKNVRQYKQPGDVNELNVASVSEPTYSPDLDITTEDTVTSIEENIADCGKEFAWLATVQTDVAVCSNVESRKDFVGIDLDKDSESYCSHICQTNEQEKTDNSKGFTENTNGKGVHENNVTDNIAENVYRQKFRNDDKDVDRISGLNASKPELKRNNRRLPESRNVERKVTLMLFTINVAFLVSFIPYFIVNLWIKQQDNSSTREFNAGIQIALRSYMLNNAINPYIIGLFNSNFRKFVKSLLCRL